MPRESFFSRIQAWFSGRFDGRYLAYILAEIGKWHPSLIRELICASCKLEKRAFRKPVFVPEYAFKGASGVRRADLAVFADEDDDEPTVLVEIKYRDKLLAESDIKPAQIDDYAHWRNSFNGRQILVLSRETLLLPGMPTLTWTQAARLLKRHAGSSDLAKALIEHLEEEGIVMQRVDPKALIGFLKRLLCPRNGTGQQVGNLHGPEEFARLLRNVKLLSARFNADFKEAWKKAGDVHNKADDPAGTKDASIDFEITPYIDTSMRLERLREDNGSLNPAARDGGLISVYARHALGSGKGWLRVGYGFQIELDNSARAEKGHFPAVYLYSWAVGQDFTGDKRIAAETRLSSFELITSKAEDSMDKLDKIASKMLLAVIEELLQNPQWLTTKQRFAVSLLKKSTAQKV
ncbi:hypothetical protein [Achromobacter sp. NFACC18-2]|uniref:hypothetical protein n=1 Tax=Achromobacter sp. NFACC18-2 TaxID=1564112 RepID=UPI0008B7465D|nr:hypothetical protein [Achromobacter sp. NFACC18-2]SEK12564.1 hypothetical protein SAMN03159494_05672 [Achromobacter sp. NFACC18-2]